MPDAAIKRRAGSEAQRWKPASGLALTVESTAAPLAAAVCLLVAALGVLRLGWGRRSN